MLEAITNLIKSSRPLQFGLVFFAGGTVAALFYPTKSIQEKIQKTYQSQISTLNQQHQQELATQKSSYEQQLQTVSQTNSQLTAKVSSLTTQVTSLQMHQKKTFYKIVHPDGTVEERASTTTDQEESQQISQQVQAEYQKDLQTKVTQLEQIQAQQVSSLQKEWDSKEQSYQSQISTLTASKSETINPKNFTLDGGLLTNKDYYGHVSYDIWGPFVLGLQGQFGPAPAAGAGLGIRF